MRQMFVLVNFTHNQKNEAFRVVYPFTAKFRARFGIKFANLLLQYVALYDL